MSPVCRMNSGGVTSALILSTAAFNVETTSGLAGLLKPIWLSLSCANASSPVDLPASSAILLRLYDFGTPPSIRKNAPVPAHAMHFRNPRRSTPSSSRSCSSSCWSDISPPVPGVAVRLRQQLTAGPWRQYRWSRKIEQWTVDSSALEPCSPAKSLYRVELRATVLHP